MKFLCQIHNIGIYIDGYDSKWRKKILRNISIQFDGFEIYNDICTIEYRLIVKSLQELSDRKDYIIVPECSKYYFDDDIFFSEYLGIAYQIKGKIATMWTDDLTWYAPYLLELLFVKQGMTFVHGAAVALNKSEGKLLLAFGGIGKTCFVANAVKRDNVTLLGDDLILLSKDGKMYSYPRPFCLYKYHMDLFPQYFEGKNIRFKTLERRMIISRGMRKIKQWMHIEDNVQYSYLPVSPIHLFPREKIQIDPVNIRDIYILRRNGKVKKITENDISDIQSAVNFALDVVLHEWDLGLKILLNHYAQKNINIYAHIRKREDIICQALSAACSLQYLDIPERMDAVEVSEKLNDIILKDGE